MATGCLSVYKRKVIMENIMKKIRICSDCRSCNLYIGFYYNIVICLDCEKKFTKENTDTVLVEKECGDCGVDTDYAIKH